MNDQNPHRNSAASDLPVEVETWLNEQPAEDASALKETWALAAYAELFDPRCEPDAVRFEQMRNTVQEAIKSPESIHRFDRAPLRLLNRRVLRLAASLIILAMAGSFWWSRPVVHVAPFGDRLNVHLADGSEVYLNSGSRLSHSRSFGSENRKIKLQGEAYFDVSHNDMPFVVGTFNGSVTVLGTRFNVRAWESDDTPETVVVLEQGSVLFAGLSDGVVPVVLEPGEMSRISGLNAPSLPVSVDINQNIAWRDGGLIFVDQLVGVVADEVQRRFNVEVEIIPASLRQERVTLKLNDARNAEEVLTTLAVARGYTVEGSKGAFKVKRP